ncbi:Aldehyde dehydrogenase OS=Streptomyces antimycoticus OX=68175 GN=SANT12839_056450 PE=4 SV=1 [Streptomyces antimycoticus]
MRFSADAGCALTLAARLRSGNVGINTAQRHPETPFGGFKESGVGRDGGSFGLHAYSELQSLVWVS